MSHIWIIPASLSSVEGDARLDGGDNMENRGELDPAAVKGRRQG
jgi:hypothetical protein